MLPTPLPFQTLTVCLEPAPEGGYIVTVPALPEVITEGDTEEEALGSAKEAILCALLARVDAHRPLPQRDKAPKPRAGVNMRSVATQSLEYA
jgi:antitoxin HicB